MTKTIKNLTENLTQMNGIRPLLFKVFLCANVFMIVLYVGFLTVIVNEAVSVRQGSKEMASMRENYQELEKNYFLALNEIDIDYAKRLGFIDRSAKVKYAVRAGSFVRR